jgi:hypothetical protein
MKTKNLFAMAAAIVVASGLAACSGEALVNDTPQEELQKKVTLSVTATQGERKQGTRMNYEEAPDATTGAMGMTLTWSAGDLLGVEPANAVNVWFTPESLTGAPEDADKNTMSFTGSVTENADNGTYFFYYPAQSMSGPSFSSDYLDRLSLSLANQSNTLTWTGANGVASTEDLWKYNLLYTPKAVNPSEGGITLTHACALLRFVLKLPADAPVVDKLYISTWEYKLPSTTLRLTFNDDGTAGTSSSTATTLSLSLSGDEKKNEVRTITAYMMVPAVSDFSGQLCKVSLVDSSTGGKTYSYIYNLTSTKATAANGNFKAGTVYTFAPSDPLQEDKWAGSNIYWDNSKLVFEQTYEMGNTDVQGVFFKWGGLEGISPNGVQWDKYINYRYIYPIGRSELYGVYWDEIRPDGGTANLSYAAGNDICAALSEGAWRMPTYAEVQSLVSEMTATPIGTPAGISGSNDNGQSGIRAGLLYGTVYIPYSGYRQPSDGEPTSVGTESNLWTNEVYDAAYAYAATTSLHKKTALPIRCIKNDAPATGGE